VLKLSQLPPSRPLSDDERHELVAELESALNRPPGSLQETLKDAKSARQLVLAGAMTKMLAGFGNHLPRVIENNANFMRQLARGDLATLTPPPRATMPPATPVITPTKPVTDEPVSEVAAANDPPPSNREIATDYYAGPPPHSESGLQRAVAELGLTGRRGYGRKAMRRFAPAGRKPNRGGTGSKG
jgi:hypothetical protein